MSYCVRKRILDFQFNAGKFAVFEPSNVLSPKGTMLADTDAGPIVLPMSYCVRKRILDFQFTGGNSPFWHLEHVLSSDGSCESRTEGGPIVFTYVLFLV